MPLTHAGRLEVSREEDSGEADEGRHAGGILPIPLAVFGEDVDFGGLEADAGIDLDHAAGPVGRAGVGRCAGAWDTCRHLQQPPKVSRFTLFTNIKKVLRKTKGYHGMPIYSQLIYVVFEE